MEWLLRFFAFISLAWQQSKLRFKRFYYDFCLPLSKRPQDFILEPLPWRNINPKTYARILSLKKHMELISPQENANIFVLGEKVQIPAEVLYRLGSKQTWFRQELGESLMQEIQKNRKLSYVTVEGKDILQLTTRAPGVNAYQIEYGE